MSAFGQIAFSLEQPAAIGSSLIMTCPVCEPIDAAVDPRFIYVSRNCDACGVEHRAQEVANEGYGITLRAGDRVEIPAGLLSLAANPLKSSGQLTREGLAMFAEQMFGTGFGSKETLDDIPARLIALQEENEALFKDDPAFEGLDFGSETDAPALIAWMKGHQRSPQWWAMMAAGLTARAAEAVKVGDAATAVWAAIAAERFRALAIFRRDFEEVVHMGNSAGRLVSLLRIWDAQKDNPSEAFWQETFKQHAYAFGQIFSAPASFIEGSAYLGGMQVDRKDARYVDFLLAEGLSDHAILVEIKTPKTPLLLNTRYRGNAYSPSRDLGGAVVQINDYCQTLREEAHAVSKSAGKPLRVINPRRIIVMGHYGEQLADPKRRESFELFRNALNGVDVITFDELFHKVEALANLFNIVRTSPPHGGDRPD